MAEVIRAGLVQQQWTGDKETMISGRRRGDRRAAIEGAQVICFQELFYGPYFCQVQDAEFYEYAESVPGPTTERFARLGGRARPGHGAAGVRVGAAGLAVQHGRGDRRRRDATWASTASTTCRTCRASGRSSTSGRATCGYPVFDTAVGRVGVYICYDRHFPEGWRALGLNGAQIVFNPSATSAGLSMHLWQLEQPAAAVANEYYIGAINRVGIEEFGDDDFYGTSYFVDPRGQLVGEAGARNERRARHPGPRPGPHRHRAQHVGVLPRPPAGRVRRPGPAVTRAAGGSDGGAPMRTLISGGTVVNADRAAARRRAGRRRDDRRGVAPVSGRPA